MKLFYSPVSPYARKIRVLAIELDLFEKIEWIESHPFDDEAQLLSANPLGKVPVLQVDGNSILDSVVICDYLQNLSEQKQSAPNPNYWKHRTQISMAQGVLDEIGRAHV